MGGREPESEVWDLTLQLEGLSLRLSRTRLPNPRQAYPTAPVSEPREGSPSAYSLASFSVVSGAVEEPDVPPPQPCQGESSSAPASLGFSTGSRPCVASPSAPQAGPPPSSLFTA